MAATRSSFRSLVLLVLLGGAWMAEAFYRLPTRAPASQGQLRRGRRPQLMRRNFFGGQQEQRQQGQDQASSSPSMLPGTTLVLRHPKTGGNVYIVGCVHGSEASEEDVTTVIEGQNPSAVVLELCESRYTSMQAEELGQAVLKAQQQEALAATGSIASAPPSPNKWLAHLAKLGARLHQFSQEFGITQTVLVALLSSSAEVQRVLTSGKGTRERAACEFRTSMELAEARNLDLVLGDQDLSTTLRRFKKGLYPWWGNKEDDKEDEEEGDKKNRAWTELASIRDALLGPADLPSSQRVEVIPLLFGQVRYLKEIVKVLIPVGVVVMVALRAVESVGDMALDSLNHLVPASTLLASLLTTASNQPPLGDASSSSVLLDGELVSNIGWGALNVLMVLYFMSINRYILVERDAFLADSIAQTVAQHKGKNVAAVVGLLHGNGVARHLRTRHGFELVDRP